MELKPMTILSFKELIMLRKYFSSKKRLLVNEHYGVSERDSAQYQMLDAFICDIELAITEKFKTFSVDA